MIGPSPSPQVIFFSGGWELAGGNFKGELPFKGQPGAEEGRATSVASTAILHDFVQEGSADGGECACRGDGGGGIRAKGGCKGCMACSCGV